MSRKKSKEDGSSWPAADRYQQRSDNKAEREIQRMEDRFAKRFEEHEDNPDLDLLLTTLQEYAKRREYEMRQLIHLAAIGVLGVVIPVVLKSEADTVVLGAVMLLMIAAATLASVRLSSTLSTNERVRKGIFEDFTRLGFSPSNVSLESLPSVWRAIDTNQITDSLLKVAQEMGLYGEKNTDIVSLDDLLDEKKASNRKLMAEFDEDSEIKRFRRG